MAIDRRQGNPVNHLVVTTHPTKERARATNPLRLLAMLVVLVGAIGLISNGRRHYDEAPAVRRDPTAVQDTTAPHLPPPTAMQQPAVLSINIAVPTPQPPPFAVLRPRQRVVIPDALQKKRKSFLSARNNDPLPLAVQAEVTNEEAGDDKERRAAFLELKKKFGNPIERAAIKRQEEIARRGGDTEQEFEQALLAVPFPERMRLRKADTNELDPAEAMNIISELDQVAATFTFRTAAEDEPEDDGVRRPSAVPSLGGSPRLCTFVPNNAFDQDHLLELQWAAHTWGDRDTILFTENATLFEDRTWEFIPGTIAKASANLAKWKAGHHRRILHRYLLRNRGATKRQLKGRGELSLPMFYMMWKERRGLFAHCDFFMKADTDAFVNRRELNAQLVTLNPEEPIYMGTPLRFSSVGFNYSQPERTIDFNVGGPGYIFSKGLIALIDMPACFADMALDPIWLIHDDVGTGYCIDKFGPPNVKYVQHRTVAIASDSSVIESLIDDDHTHWVLPRCVLCAQVVHPLASSVVERIGRVLRRADERRREKGSGPAMAVECTSEECGVVAIQGWPAFVGANWSVPHELKVQLSQWPNNRFEQRALTRQRP